MIKIKNILSYLMVVVVVGLLAGFTPVVSATTQEAGVVMVPNNFSQLAKDAIRICAAQAEAVETGRCVSIS